MARRPAKWWVYVVELDPAATSKKSVKGVVYVGETSLTPDERFAKHKTGHKASRKVYRYGLHLVPELAPKSAFLTKENSLKAEKRTADKLRRQGYIVFGGQGLPFMAAQVAEAVTRGTRR